MRPLRIHEELLDLAMALADDADHAASAVGHHHDALGIGKLGFELRTEHARLDGLAIHGLQDLDVLPIRQTRGADLETADCRPPTAYFKNPS